MSIYTYHLIEALQGAGNEPGETVVQVSNLMNYVSKTTTLLELARELIVRAEDNAGAGEPMPVLFNLSSWKDDK